MIKSWERNKITNKRTQGKPRVIKDSFLIVSEGEKTEPLYFDSFEVKSAKIKTVGLGYNTLSLVKEAIKIRKQEELNGFTYDQVWVVFDRDDFHCTFNDAVFLAEKNNLKVAFSNEAFELWYLLHFIYFDSNISRAQYIDKLKKYIPDYSKGKVGIYNDIITKQPIAIKNAKKLISLHDLNNPNRAEPCTTVVYLVEELNLFM